MLFLLNTKPRNSCYFCIIFAVLILAYFKQLDTDLLVKGTALDSTHSQMYWVFLSFIQTVSISQNAENSQNHIKKKMHHKIR